MVYPQGTGGRKGKEEEGGELGPSEGTEDCIKNGGIELQTMVSATNGDVLLDRGGSDKSGEVYSTEAADVKVNPMVASASKDLLLERGSDAEQENSSNEGSRSVSGHSSVKEEGEHERSGAELDFLASIRSGDRLLQSLGDGGTAEAAVDSD